MRKEEERVAFRERLEEQYLVRAVRDCQYCPVVIGAAITTTLGTKEYLIEVRVQAPKGGVERKLCPLAQAASNI